MRLKAAGIVLLSLSFAQHSLACGAEINGIKPGDKLVGIELEERGKKVFAMDDDGFLVTSLVAAICNRRAPIETTLSEKQKDCAMSTQLNADTDFDNRISVDNYNEEEMKNDKTSKLIKSKCGFDLVAAWKKAATESGNTPLTCAKDAYPILKKAAARNAEYVAEQTKPSYLANIKGTEEDKKRFVDNLKADQAYLAKLANLFSTTPVKTSEYQALLKDLAPVANRHAYQVKNSPDSSYDREDQVNLTSILGDLNANLPFVMRSRCGGGMPSNLLETLKSAIWEPRGSGPGTQGGENQSRGSKVQ